MLLDLRISSIAVEAVLKGGDISIDTTKTETLSERNGVLFGSTRRGIIAEITGKVYGHMVNLHSSLCSPHPQNGVKQVTGKSWH